MRREGDGRRGREREGIKVEGNWNGGCITNEFSHVVTKGHSCHPECIIWELGASED